MADQVHNVALGRLARYADLPGTGDRFVWVLLQALGLESDATLKDYDTLADILVNNAEATFTGYARVPSTTITVTVDDAADTVLVDDTVDPSWSPTSVQNIGKVLVCYDPTGASPDSDLIPLWSDDYIVTTPVTGGISYQVQPGGFYEAH